MRIKHILLGLLSLAALASCSIKDDLQPAQPTRLFRAVMEQTVADPATKAYATFDSDMNKYFVFWNRGDRVSIFYDKTYNREYEFLNRDGNTSGDFGRVGTDPSPVPGQTIGSGYQYAIYPYNEGNTCDAQGTLTVVIPDQQTYYDDARGIGARMLMVARDEAGDFTFKHVGSYLGVRLKGEGVSVASLTLQGNNGEYLSGYPQVSFDENETPVLTFDPSNAADVVTMTLETPIALNQDEYEEFWLMLPPVTFSEGFTLTVKDTEGGIYERKITSSITLERRNFYTLSSTAEFTPAPLDESSYALASSITVDGTYLVVSKDDDRLFKGSTDGSYVSVSPVDGVITDTDGTLAAYEFTVEKSGNNYYLKFNDGKYLVCDYGNSGNGTTGLRYVDAQSNVTYPYALTVNDGVFEFNTTQMTSTSSTNQVLYYKPASAGGTGPDRFKIGGSGVGVGVHLYMKGGKQARGLKFEPESVTCLQGSTPEKPVLSGNYSTVRYSSDNTAVATVDGNGNVTVVGIGIATITAEADEDDRYQAGSASYTLTVLDSSTASYVKAASITVGGTYLIVDKDDDRLFKGLADGSYVSVSPENGVIIDYDRTLSAYEFTVEKSGNNYYLKFNDGKYLVCDYGNSGNGTTGLRYVDAQSNVTYPYALTVNDGVFEFNTTQMTSTSSTNQVLYYKPASAGGTGPDRFKIGGSGVGVGVHLYMKGGKRDRGLKFEPESVTCFQGSTPEKPVLSGTYTTARYSSDNTSVATVDATSGTVTVKGLGTAVITASVDEDDDYVAGTATYTLTILDPNGSSYTKVSSITVGGTYLIVDKDDARLFKGATDGSYMSVSPKNGVITDTDRTLSAYEFTVEKSGNNYYLKFNDGKYLVCDYGNSGNGTTGLRYVDAQSNVTYPYALTVNDGVFEFNTTQMTSTSSTNQVLYYKPASAGGTGPDRFKIGGSGVGVGVHLYMKGGKRDRGLKFEPESVTCFQGSTPEKPVLSGTYTTARYSSDNTSVATVDATSGTVTVKGLGTAVITASVDEDDDYVAGTATYTLTILDPNGSSYTKVSSITVGGTYLIVDKDDARLFKGATDGSYMSVSPKNGVITDTDRTLSAYEFTVEKSGNNYYLKFNDGKYLVCDYGNSGNGTTGLRYVDAQSNVTYPYALTVNDGVFEFNTTQMTSTSSTNQVLYYKPASAGGTGPDRFKIGGSGVGVGVHLYLKGGGGDTPAKQTQTLSFAQSTITWTIGEGGDHVKGESYAFPQTVTGAKTSVSYTSETPAVVTISNNRITIVDAGSATIKATAAETDDYYGNTATYTLNIATPAPAGWVDLGSFNLENTAVKDYLTYAEGAYTDTNEKDVTNVVYYATDSKYSSISRKDCPAPVTITWTNPGSKSTVVTIYADQALTQQVWSQPATEGNSTTTSSDVYNLIPGLTYYYTVSENGSVWEKGQFNTTGRRRMLRVSGEQSTDRANNCRDLGGMITKDGTKRIKYGYIFRGSNMNSTTDSEKSILADFMKIRMDIDLRASGWGTQGASRAFPESDYPVIGYLNKGFSGYSDLASDSGLGRVGDIFNTIIDTVLEGKAVYFHCYVGADRTGIIGVILEGMLGISEKDCSIDYELTTFSRAVGNRPRDGSQNDHYFSQGLALLRGQSGSTFEQKCTNFLTSSKVGVSETKIKQFKNYILEGNN